MPPCRHIWLSSCGTGIQYPVRPTNLFDLTAAFDLFQDPHDLLFSETTFAHGGSPLHRNFAGNPVAYRTKSRSTYIQRGFLPTRHATQAVHLVGHTRRLAKPKARALVITQY